MQARLIALRDAMHQYAVLDEVTWDALSVYLHSIDVAKGDVIYREGEVPSSFSFIYQGLVRCFVNDEHGNQYNKLFFDEGMFPGAMSSLLTQTPSMITFEALEATQLVAIDFHGFRQVLDTHPSLMRFHIAYLEQNWLLKKEPREIEIVMQDAAVRYQQFLTQYPALAARLPQYHIASHLGITPTQLSRIRAKQR